MVNGDVASLTGMSEPRFEAQTRVWDNLNTQESMVRKKLRLKGLKDGDHYSKFFNFFIKFRFQKNSIVGFTFRRDVG